MSSFVARERDCFSCLHELYRTETFVYGAGKSISYVDENFSMDTFYSRVQIFPEAEG